MLKAVSYDILRKNKDGKYTNKIYIDDTISRVAQWQNDNERKDVCHYNKEDFTEEWDEYIKDWED